MSRLLLALLTALLATAGCGALPRPFEPVDKASNDLVRLEDGIGISVLPVTHEPPGAPGAAAEALADAIRKHNVPASTQGVTAGSRTLTGRAVVQALSTGKEEVLLYWELSDPDGARVGSFAQRGELQKGAWQAGRPEVITELMERAAAKVAAMVQDPAVEEAPPPPGTRLVILPMADLPGDGGRSLASALETALRAAGLPLAEHPEDSDDLLIACTVALGPPQGASQDVRVGWTVTRAGDGAELGRIDQRNLIPAGSLDGPWGMTAQGIAAGAAEGIIALIGQVDSNI